MVYRHVKALDIIKTPTYRAMLQDVLDSPQDDIPRLLLADYIDDEGWTDRAEFIRWQIAHPESTDSCHGDAEVGLPCGWGGDACPVCQDLELFDLMPPQLLGEGAPGESRFRIRRGFVEEIRCGLPTWLEYGRQAVGTNPITKVEVFKRPFDRKSAPHVPNRRFRWVISKMPASSKQCQEIPYFIPRELHGCYDGIRKMTANWLCEAIVDCWAYHATEADAMKVLNDRLLDVAKNGPYPRA